MTNQAAGCRYRRTGTRRSLEEVGLDSEIAALVRSADITARDYIAQAAVKIGTQTNNRIDAKIKTEALTGFGFTR
ncbi:MAG: hypothetical protein D6709_09030 [Chloroflexi bacterium]|uniref:Uncharacterized protein n=1 Tax=Candidatus Thermofonsia Clade 3 bacterium TaxID=2364212 RepID=A0A2M8QFY7_9CHLR|nr:MAG: hypothetical protein CUN48_02535 [Candidatus Thermofonsia Clade 3 bacterium]RMG63286.1 MAG: hypothetical protein D6709_09030 [Chloroflexota bacterium]